jgi:hypothetical protein
LNSCIEYTAQQLTELKQRHSSSANDIAWEMARLYVMSYQAMADELKARGEKATPHRINKAIRSVEGYHGPSGTWLYHTKRTNEQFNDIFCGSTAENILLPYEHYLRIAISTVPDKQSLLAWAEEYQPTQPELRQRIRELVDADETRPDFPLRVSNYWKFSEKTSPDGFDGGIHPAIVANLMHYYTEPDDTVIDPMAGSGTTARVLNTYHYFQEHMLGLPHSGRRRVLMSDIAPISPEIIQADAVEGLPWEDDMAALAIVDPPYWRIANGKYDTLGETISQWRTNMQSVLRHCARVVHTGGHIAVIVDDYLRKGHHEPLAAYVMIAALSLGLIPAGTIYNTYPNFVVTMTPMMMNQAKKARMMVSEMKIINVFQRIDGQFQ